MGTHAIRSVITGTGSRYVYKNHYVNPMNSFCKMLDCSVDNLRKKMETPYLPSRETSFGENWQAKFFRQAKFAMTFSPCQDSRRHWKLFLLHQSRPISSLCP